MTVPRTDHDMDDRDAAPPHRRRPGVFAGGSGEDEDLRCRAASVSRFAGMRRCPCRRPDRRSAAASAITARTAPEPRGISGRKAGHEPGRMTAPRPGQTGRARLIFVNYRRANPGVGLLAPGLLPGREGKDGAATGPAADISTEPAGSRVSTPLLPSRRPRRAAARRTTTRSAGRHGARRNQPPGTRASPGAGEPGQTGCRAPRGFRTEQRCAA